MQEEVVVDTAPETPMLRCGHGVRIAAGDTYARYCSGCSTEPLHILAPTEQVPEVHHVERTLAADEFISLPANVRLSNVKWEEQ